MPAPFDSSWQDSGAVTADKLDRTTHGSGTTSERNAITSWPTNRLFYDTTLRKLYRNVGSQSNVSWEDIAEPPGIIKMWAGSRTSPPSGYLICDGSAVSRSTYSDLFSTIGTAFGSGNGSTTFNLPNFNDRFPRGESATTPGGTGGAASVSLSTANLPSHNHSIPQQNVQQFDGTQPGASNAIDEIRTIGNASNPTWKTHSFLRTPATTSGSTGSGTAHNNLPPYVDLYFLIKT